jgi:hypothetical protein
MTTQHPADGVPTDPPLSPEDASALRQTAHDLSDLDPQTVARARDGFRHAYEVAQRVSDGTLDPLSA